MVEGVRRELREDGAEDRADHDVAGVVDSCVHAEVTTMPAAACSGTATTGKPLPTPVEKAKAAAEWPDGKDSEVGIRTWRAVA